MVSTEGVLKHGKQEVRANIQAAERAIRPMVVSRKESGGTRSKLGSWVKSIFMTLMATWRLRGLNPMAECLNMIASVPA